MTDPLKTKIGFIGLGAMGCFMASHLVRAGYAVKAYDVIPEALEAVVSVGAQKADSPQTAAQDADVIITMLPNTEIVENVAIGSEGIVQVAKKGQIFIDMSTISPHTAIKISEVLAKKGVRCLDAPVSGGMVGARDAILSIMVGGDEDLFKEMNPIFMVMGKTLTHCGKAGAGQIVKVCNQIMVGCIEAGMGEALVLGAKAGIDPEIVIKVLSGGYAQSRIMDVRGPMIVEGNNKGGATCKMHAKDLGIIMDTAKELQVSLPVSGIVQQLIFAMLAAGREDYDHYAMYTVLEDMAKTKVSKR